MVCYRNILALGVAKPLLKVCDLCVKALEVLQH